MAEKDYQKEYWERITAWNEKQRAKRKENENHSFFTIVSMIGFVLGVGFFYKTPHVVIATVILTVLGALVGAGIDFYQLRHSSK